MHNPTPVTLAPFTGICVVLAALVGCGDDPRYQQRTPSSPTTTSSTTNNASNNPNQTTAPEDDWCPGLDYVDPDRDPTPWNFVTIVDLSKTIGDPDYPGVAIDAIELITEDGQRRFATTLWGVALGGGNARDTNAVMGPPDANCEARSGFVALGGGEEFGFVTVGFNVGEEYQIFGQGSTITLHTVNTTACGTPDPNLRYEIAVSEDAFNFTWLSDDEGTNALTTCVDRNYR